jgi:lysine 2,3-aminomutase
MPLSWKSLLKKNFTKWESLCDFLELEELLRARILKRSSFPLNLPLRLAQKIAKNQLDDPILRQFVPLVEEESIPDKDRNYSPDPLLETSFRKTSKLLHKYPGRALLVTTSACAMHCRFCFRRHFSYETENKSFEEEIRLISEDSSLSEVILSGGDPLSLSNETLGTLLDSLEKIPHVKRVRFHTRVPIGIP